MTKGFFVCPEYHLQALNRVIPEVTEIAVVGWRAGEQHFLKLLTEYLRDHVRVIAVCGDLEATNATLKQLHEAGVRGEFHPEPGGFSDFVVNHRIEPFLSAR